MHRTKKVIPAVGATMGLEGEKVPTNKRQSQCGLGVGNVIRIHCMDGKPDGRQENKTEKEERHKVLELVPDIAGMVFAVGSAISP